ncbi:hypothetical protein HX798_23105 [Pseudomonas putida]|uniref:Uncharacterized protein n=1 Tax=Pseudomonas putida TaxID=303 RepID=A0A7Y7ZG28_PSEPU|nr:hypothetical protein [Pseudomonas putida]NWC83154.1 hypothetical protein [Pseudomonas putida]
MSTWNLAALIAAVKELHGSDQEKELTPSLNSLVQRGAFAKYHYLEAKRLLETATQAHTQPGEMMLLLLGNDSASAGLRQARFQAAAHLTACVQSMHATADTLAHAVYFALGMNLDQATYLEPRSVTIWKVKEKLSTGPIKNLLAELVDHDDFKYLSALCNHSKHRSIVDIPFSLEMTATYPSGIKFGVFKYNGNEISDRWALPTLDAEYARQSSLIIAIGQALNSTLIP